MSFTAQVRTLVEEHYLDHDFNVIFLAERVGLSYSQLARRLRAEANVNPTKLVRIVRLERAAQMINAGASNMTEVADAVGFRSLSYFSRCFRSHFGIPPSRYRHAAAA